MSLFASGFFSLSWWGVIALALVLTHVTILSVTIYLHRGCAHRALSFHPALEAFFRFWIWLTTGMGARQWAAVHRKHHAKCETDEDPHSPQRRGLLTVLFKGVWLYRAEASNPSTISRYGAGTPNDAFEHFIQRYSWLGMILLFAVELFALGFAKAVTLWLVQILWIPVWAAGVINGIGHFWGYRNHHCADASRNISPIAIFIGGEELHNNHHAFPSSAELSSRSWEFDWGWQVIRGLSALGALKIHRRMPRIHKDPSALASEIGVASVEALIAGRFDALREARKTLMPFLRQQLRSNPAFAGVSSRRFMSWFFLDQGHLSLSPMQEAHFERLLSQSPALLRTRQLLVDLKSLWTQANLTLQDTISRFSRWCHDAEHSGIEGLRSLSLTLRSYRLAQA